MSYILRMRCCRWHFALHIKSQDEQQDTKNGEEHWISSDSINACSTELRPIGIVEPKVWKEVNDV